MLMSIMDFVFAMGRVADVAVAVAVAVNDAGDVHLLAKVQSS